VTMWTKGMLMVSEDVKPGLLPLMHYAGQGWDNISAHTCFGMWNLVFQCHTYLHMELKGRFFFERTYRRVWHGSICELSTWQIVFLNKTRKKKGWTCDKWWVLETTWLSSNFMLFHLDFSMHTKWLCMLSETPWKLLRFSLEKKEKNNFSI
jgi:hypothetical protein